MATNWQTIQSFIEKEIERGQADKDHDQLLYNSLVLLYQAILGYLALARYLEPPENRGMRQCPWCKEEFKPLYRFTVACSDECDRLWRLYPPTMTKREHDQAVREVLQLEAQKKAQS